MVVADFRRWVTSLLAESRVARWRVLLAVLPVPTALLGFQFAFGRYWEVFVLFRNPALRRDVLGSFPEWWFTLTRFTYALVHLQDQFRLHLLGNVAGILVVTALLYLVFAAMGRQRLYWVSYLGLFVLTPPLTSVVYLPLGDQMYGLGASGVAFAYCALLAIVLVWYASDRIVPDLEPTHALPIPALAFLTWSPAFVLVGPFVLAAAGLLGYFGFQGIRVVRNAPGPGSTPETRTIGFVLVTSLLFPVVDALTGTNVGHQFGFFLGANYGVVLFAAAKWRES